MHQTMYGTYKTSLNKSHKTTITLTTATKFTLAVNMII